MLLWVPQRAERASFLPLPLCLRLGRSVSNTIKPSCLPQMLCAYCSGGTAPENRGHRSRHGPGPAPHTMQRPPFICLVPHTGTDPPQLCAWLLPFTSRAQPALPQQSGEGARLTPDPSGPSPFPPAQPLPEAHTPRAFSLPPGTKGKGDGGFPLTQGLPFLSPRFDAHSWCHSSSGEG